LVGPTGTAASGGARSAQTVRCPRLASTRQGKAADGRPADGRPADSSIAVRPRPPGLCETASSRSTPPSARVAWCPAIHQHGARGAAWPQRRRRGPGARPGAGLLPRPAPRLARHRGDRVQVVAPPRFSTGRFPQPDGTVLYELVTGHPDRQSREGSSVGGVAVAVVVGSIPVSPVRCGTRVARPAKLDAVRTLQRRHELGRRVRSLQPRPSTCRPEASMLYAMHAGAWRTKVNALIAFYLSNAPLRANAAKGVTG
jgi:hypothetical protein